MSTKNSQKQPFFKRVGRWFKEFVSELKKVSWAPIPKVLKQTGVVLTLVGVFLLVMIGFDTVLGIANRALIENATSIGFFDYISDAFASSGFANFLSI